MGGRDSLILTTRCQATQNFDGSCFIMNSWYWFYVLMKNISIRHCHQKNLAIVDMLQYQHLIKKVNMSDWEITFKLCIQTLNITVKNTVISTNFLVSKFCGKAQFTHSFGRFARNYAETVPFHKISTPGN